MTLNQEQIAIAELQSQHRKELDALKARADAAERVMLTERSLANHAAEALAAARREVRLHQLFVLAAHWLLSGLQRDVEASEPAVLLYTPLWVAANRVLNAFQPPGTVRSFTGTESAALIELAAAARAYETASNKPLGGESGEWWQTALKHLSLPSIPWGREMEHLRAALAAPAAGDSK